MLSVMSHHPVLAPVLQLLHPGDRVITVPSCCQVQYTTDRTDASLAELFDRVPVASGTGQGAWQFKMALQASVTGCRC